ncbi:MAG TPA: hypothetical protein VMY78_05760 [Solirubrobacteraceae bacterium]|nr:hypothetical protein [Solirubrobacteraceae bacterium]
MDAGVYVLVFGGFFVALLATVAAVTVPAPRRPVDAEAGVNLTLLGVGSLATIATGLLALGDLPVHSAVCGAIACLVVIPCLWLARAPLPPEGDGGWEADDDDGGGTPGPVWPSAPPAPDDGGLPSLAPPAMPVARPALAHTHSFTLPAAPSVAHATTPATCQAEPAPARRRLQAPPRLVRGDHRFVEHKRAAQPHTGRRRRASLGLRMLRRCRGWFWPEVVVSEETHRLRQLVCDPGDRIPASAAHGDSPGASSSRAEGGGRPHECRVSVSVSVDDSQPATRADHRPCGLLASEGAVLHTLSQTH